MSVIVNPCNRKDICYNYPKHCDLCITTSDSVNCYPCFQDKDIVEVVRCKDCKFFYDGKRHRRCMVRGFKKGFRVGPNDFCSSGKRKDDSDEKT